MTDRLKVLLDFGPDVPRLEIGMLAWSASRRSAALEWSPAFRDAPLPVSPYLARNLDGLLQPTDLRAFDGLPGLVGDSLPDGWGRLLIDREIRARGIRDITPVERLAMVGQHGMGALVYLPDAPAAQAGPIDLDSFSALVPKIEAGTEAVVLEHLRGIAGGSQGARPKFVALHDPETGELHDHRSPWRNGLRPVLVKRRAETDPPGAIKAEAAYARLARAAGIGMSCTGILHARSGEAFFATERFDRDGPRRWHMQSAAALTDSDFRQDSMDYIDLLKLTKMVTRDIRDTEELFRRMVFNVVFHNRDDHLKNHAFLMGVDGHWRLSPAYDLSYSTGPAGHHTLPVAGATDRITRTDCLEVAKRAGLKPRRAQAMIDEVCAATGEWIEAAETMDVPGPLVREIGEAIAGAQNRMRS